MEHTCVVITHALLNYLLHVMGSLAMMISIVLVILHAVQEVALTQVLCPGSC